MTSKIKRKLAAIMFTDIVGYTKQMSEDQNYAFELLEEKESKFIPLIKNNNGELIKQMGDGTLSYYPTATDASKCSLEFQKIIYNNHKLNIRIGIHIGDTLFKGGDVFGDGVNIASRLESMSPAGGILVSKSVFDELLSQNQFDGISLGLQSLKGVGRLIEVYALKASYLTLPDPSLFKNTKVKSHTDNEAPSIAIIPFENKGIKEDAFYAYGISVDLISEVTSIGSIRVASKKHINDLGEIPIDKLAKKLDVRYVVSGELWRMDNIFQLSIELYDTKNKKILWSDRWQEQWENLPAIKMNLSDGLLKFLDKHSKQHQKSDVIDPIAYEYYLQSKYKFDHRKNENDIPLSIDLVNKSLEINKDFILAKILKANIYMQTKSDYDISVMLFKEVNDYSNDNDDYKGQYLSFIGLCGVSFYKADYSAAIAYINKAISIAKDHSLDLINPTNNLVSVLGNQGFLGKALDQAKILLNLCKQSGTKIQLADVMANIARIKINMGLLSKEKYEIEDLLIKSISIYNKAEQFALKYESMINLGVLYSNIPSKSYDKKSLKYFTECIMFFKKTDNQRPLAFLYYAKGNLQLKSGDINNALKNYLKSIEYNIKVNNKYNLCEVYNSIGDIYEVKNKLKSSLEYRLKAYEISLEINALKLKIESLISIGRCYFWMCDYNNCIKFFKKANSISKDEKEVFSEEKELTINLYLASSNKKLKKDFSIYKKNILNNPKIKSDLDTPTSILLYTITKDEKILDKLNSLPKNVKDMTSLYFNYLK